MKKHLLFTFSVVLFGCGTFAQTQASGPSSEVLQSCLLGTDAGTWGTLKLTSDQLERVRRVQEACKEECAASMEKSPTQRSISTADGNTVIAELKNILTPEQYQAWSAQCAGGAGTAPAPASK